MTPDKVIEAAHYLVDQEVDLTLRGWVRETPDGLALERHGLTYNITMSDRNGRPEWDLVDIERAPLRIKPGGLYIDDNGAVYSCSQEGIFHVDGSGRTIFYASPPKGLRPAKAVTA